MRKRSKEKTKIGVIADGTTIDDSIVRSLERKAPFAPVKVDAFEMAQF